MHARARIPDRRPVALKLIASSLARDPVFRARFEQECRLAATIDHPHAVEVFHAGQEAGLLYVTMRYVEGTDLKALLHEEGRLEPARAVRIVAQVAGGAGRGAPPRARAPRRQARHGQGSR